MSSLRLRKAFCWILCTALSGFSTAGLAQTAADPALPLHTAGREIVDAQNHPVRLMGVNWFGFDEGEFVAGGLDRAPLEEIAATIHRLGFNTVRLPYANQVVEDNPLVPDYAVAANPQFKGKHAMEIMDAVIAALARQHVMIVLDDHVSRADWCCAEKDGNGLWYNRDYPETSWIADWQGLVRRYAGERWVIGADLRNELRSGAVWGGNDSAVDWHAAAERGGNAVLAMNPHLLIMVEGVSYSTDLSRVGALPVKLAVPHQLVYSPHEYGFHRPSDASYEALHERLDKRWGYLEDGPDPAPMWLGEFGYCQQFSECVSKSFGQWFPNFVRYVHERNLSWAYWPLNGTQSSGQGRLFGTVEYYGLLGPDEKSVAAPEVLKLLEQIGLHETSALPSKP